MYDFRANAQAVVFALALATANMRLETAWSSSAPKDTLVNHNLSCFLAFSGCKPAAILKVTVS